jgi:hypothetical protein
MLQKLESAPTLYQALRAFVGLAGSESSRLRLDILERHHDVLFYTHYPALRGLPGY